MKTQKKEFGGIVLSPSCQNNCIFCGSNPGVSPEELKRQEIKVIKALKDLKLEGTNKIEITGADPVEYYEIIPLIKYLKKSGFVYVQLSTHGRKLSDEDFLNKLAGTGVDRLRIPLYGSTADIHDAITQGKGSFEETLNGLKKLSKLSHNISLMLFTLITKQNKDDLTNIIDLAYSLKASDFYISIPCVSNGDYSYYIPIKNLGPIVKKVIEHCKQKNYRIRFMEIPYCVFGTTEVELDNTGQPPNLGKYFQPKFKSGVKDMPSYRVKAQVEMCKSCICNKICDGFFVNDVSVYGTGDLKPLKKSSVCLYD